MNSSHPWLVAAMHATIMVINATLELMLWLLFELHVITSAAACLWNVSHEKEIILLRLKLYKLRVVERAERPAKV